MRRVRFGDGEQPQDQAYAEMMERLGYGPPGPTIANLTPPPGATRLPAQAAAPADLRNIVPSIQTGAAARAAPVGPDLNTMLLIGVSVLAFVLMES